MTGYGWHGVADDVVQGARFMAATPLVIASFWFESTGRVCLAVAGGLERASLRVEGVPR